MEYTKARHYNVGLLLVLVLFAASSRGNVPTDSANGCELPLYLPAKRLKHALFNFQSVLPSVSQATRTEGGRLQTREDLTFVDEEV